jgi:type I restriction enzyme, S subunit
MKYKRYDKYKKTGVEWTPEVPDNWEFCKISHGFLVIGSGTTPRSDNSDYYDGQIPWVTTSELREKVIYDTKKKLTTEAVLSNSALRLYEKGSLLIAMYGATIGRLGILGIKATVNQACCVFDKPIKFDTKFVFWWFRAAKPILLSQSSGGGQPNLSQDLLKQLKVSAPSPLEQKEIADYLDGKTSKIDLLLQKLGRQIELLKEYRASLITSAVTGQIKITSSSN